MTDVDHSIAHLNQQFSLDSFINIGVLHCMSVKLME